MCEICGDRDFDLVINIDTTWPENPNEFILACTECAKTYDRSPT